MRGFADSHEELKQWKTALIFPWNGEIILFSDSIANNQIRRHAMGEVLIVPITCWCLEI